MNRPQSWKELDSGAEGIHGWDSVGCWGTGVGKGGLTCRRARRQAAAAGGRLRLVAQLPAEDVAVDRGERLVDTLAISRPDRSPGSGFFHGTM